MKVIQRSGPISATVAIPSSKSFTARALLLAAMSEGTTTVLSPLDSDDSRYMLEAIKKIGWEVSGSFKDGLVFGERVSMSANEVELFVGNAGTAMRFLTGFLAFTPGRFLLGGEARMHERPIGDLVDALLHIGAEIEYADREGYPPLRMRGKRMRGGFEVSVAGDVSSQFISSLMMAGATLPSGLDLRILSVASRPYLDITRSILADFGVQVHQLEANLLQIRASKIRREVYEVEGDYSSASYWVAAAAATRGTVKLTRLRRDSAQGDRRFLDIVREMGCDVAWEDDGVSITGPQQLRGGTFDCNDVPDIVPTLAAIAPLADSTVTITNVANLRVKESDRIAVMAMELAKLGVRVRELEDGLVIEPGWNDAPATIATHNDHRIAMSFAVAGMARGNVTIENEQVVSKSYPRFWRTLDEVTK